MKTFKKIFILIIIIGLALFSLSRFRQKNFTPEEVSKLFVDGLVYNNQQQDFERTFKNHQQYRNYMATDFPSDSLAGFNLKVGNVDIKKLTEKMLVSYNENIDKTSVELINATESNNIITATYSVKGYDLRPFLKTYIKNVFGELLNLSISDIANIRNNTKQTNDILLDAFEKSANEISIAEKGKEVTFKFLKNGSTYELKDSSKTLQNFSLIFYTGFEQNSELQNFIDKYINISSESLLKQ